MHIALKRAVEPGEVGVEEECGICGMPFVAEAIVARVVVDDVSNVCPSCVEYLGRRNPERYPSIGVYREANLHYPEPMFGDVGEVLLLEEAGGPSAHEVYEASWLSRA